MRRKTCELCGEEFQCGADEGDCWCGSVFVDPDRLRWLSTVASDCVCPKCLTAEDER